LVQGHRSGTHLQGGGMGPRRWIVSCSSPLD
jgi:hypothetical protein